MHLPAALLGELEHACGGQLSFVVREMVSGEEVVSRPDRLVPTASVYKLYVLLHVACAAEEGTLNWDMPLTLTTAHQSPGTGVLGAMTPGLTLSVRDACFLMTAVSDNTATNMLLSQVGIGAVNDRLRSFGLNHTALSPQPRTPDAPRRPLATGHTTPRETANLLAQLLHPTWLPLPAASEVRTFLAAQQDRSMIGRRCPPGWSYAGKTGVEADLRADVGTLTAPDGREFVLALFCHGLPVPPAGPDWGVDHPGTLALAELARQAVSHESARFGNRA